MLSQRSQQIFAKPSAIFASHAVCAQDPYALATNPGGYVNLGTAENRLVWDLLEPRLAAARRSHEADSHYGPTYGHPGFRQALARFLGRATGAKLEAENFVVANGATAILDMLAFVLCDPEDAFIVPAPYYAGFDVDLAGRSRASIVPAYLKAETGFRLTRESLEAAWQDAQAQGVKARAVLVASPSNPLGRALDAGEIAAALEFAAARDLHCIFDEIYLRSCFPGTVSASVLSRLGVDQGVSDRVHVVYAMSKDFSLAGYRVGACYTLNTDVLTAMRRLTYFNNTSMATQHQLAELLDDQRWVDGFLAENARRIEQAYRHAERLLGDLFTFAPANAGVFAWVSLARYLDEPSFAGEARLHERLMREAKVNILPGRAFHAGEPGWFRLCYANVPHLLEVAAGRLRAVLMPANMEKP